MNIAFHFVLSNVSKAFIEDSHCTVGNVSALLKIAVHRCAFASQSVKIALH